MSNEQLYYELSWLTNELSKIQYSDRADLNCQYQLGLLKSILAQCMHNDSLNRSVIRTVLIANPYRT